MVGKETPCTKNIICVQHHFLLQNTHWKETSSVLPALCPDRRVPEFFCLLLYAFLHTPGSRYLDSSIDICLRLVSRSLGSSSRISESIVVWTHKVQSNIRVCYSFFFQNQTNPKLDTTKTRHNAMNLGDYVTRISMVCRLWNSFRQLNSVETTAHWRASDDEIMFAYYLMKLCLLIVWWNYVCWLFDLQLLVMCYRQNLDGQGRWYWWHQITVSLNSYRVAKTHRMMPYLYGSLSAKEPYNQWLFCANRPATQRVASGGVLANETAARNRRTIGPTNRVSRG